MTDFDLDLSGVENLQAEFENLEEQNEDPPEFEVGTNVEYAKFLEFGTEKMPPYPFFRPAIRELRLNPEVFLRKNLQTTPAEADSIGELVVAYASALERQLKLNVTAEAGFGRSPGTDPEHPKVQTGTLRSDIESVRLD